MCEKRTGDGTWNEALVFIPQVQKNKSLSFSSGLGLDTCPSALQPTEEGGHCLCQTHSVWPSLRSSWLSLSFISCGINLLTPASLDCKSKTK